jgi:inner membrane protein
VNKPLIMKTAVVALLAFALMLPVSMIRDLVAERQARQSEAITGIAEGWGKRQTVAGPYIAIPYERYWTEVKRETVEGKLREASSERSESSVVRLPASSIEWSVLAHTTEKARGIYKVRLYSARIQAHGTLALPARSSFEDASSRYKWGTPRLVFGISDPLGIRAAPDVSFGAGQYGFAPGSGDATVPAGLHAPLGNLALNQARTLDFSLTLELAGSEALSIAPLGADTSVSIQADWPHPSFQGRFLPVSHDLRSDGFTANWKISRFAQGAGEANRAQANCAWPCARMSEQIAVSFMEPAGLYQQLVRASKYGFLFIGLTFAAFVLFELLLRLAIHPVQYTLVGLALAMFFLLLTALSEHIDFAFAYAIGAFACVALVGAYLVRVLRSVRLALGFSAALASLYAVLFALLKAEDYALLGGSLLLFGLLALVMLATRRVDWYALTALRTAQTASAT